MNKRTIEIDAEMQGVLDSLSIQTGMKEREIVRQAILFFGSKVYHTQDTADTKNS